MDIRIVTTFENAIQYLLSAKNNQSSLPELWQKYLIEPFWADISKYAPFDISFMQPSHIQDLAVLKEQIDLLAEVSLSQLKAKFIDITKSLPVEDNDPMLVAIYPICNHNKTVKERQNGVVGAGAFGNIILNINPLATDWQNWVPYVFAHEYHHKVWGHNWYVLREGKGLEGTFLESIINEGQADLFAESLFPNLIPQWNRDLNDATEAELWNKVKPMLFSTDREAYQAYMFGNEEEGLPWCIGYSFGRAMVADYLLNHPNISFAELINVPAREIYEASRFFSDKTWGRFKSEQERLGLQEVNPIFLPESGMSAASLRAGFVDLKNQLSNESAAIRKAKLYAYILTHAQVVVDEDDWFVGLLDHQNLMAEYNHVQMTTVPEHLIPQAVREKQQAENTGFFETGLDIGHVSPGWRYVLAKGIGGIRAEADERRKNLNDSLASKLPLEVAYADPKRGEPVQSHEYQYNLISQEQNEFYECIEIVYGAISNYILRLAHAVEGKLKAISLMDGDGSNAGREGQKVRLKRMKSSLNHIANEPPRDFHEALQFAYILHQMIELEGEWVRSMGGFDRNFYSYYAQDIKEQRLTPDQAKELIQFFFMKFFAVTKGAGNGKNFYFGGQLADGSNAENELTYLALAAYHEMNVTDPKLSVRFYHGSSQRLYKQVAESIRSGRTSFVLANDEVIIPGIIKCGKTIEEARDYLLIGCYEPAIEGKEIACNMSTTVSLAKCIELVMNQGVDVITNVGLGPDTGNPIEFATYEEFEKAFFIQLSYMIDRAVWAVREYESCWPLMNPSAVLAGTFRDCLHRGKDIGQSGPKYNNTGIMAAGLANAVDSLSVVRELVFRQKQCTMAELRQATLSDFRGFEKLELLIKNRIPRWGNGITEVDEIAVRIVDFYHSYVHTLQNNRGGKMVPSMFSIQHRQTLGAHTATLPDGRKRKEPLSLNNAANQGQDAKGVTALIRSMTKLDYTKLPNGSITDIYLHPSAVQGDEGLHALISLIKTYFKLGGANIQFNIFDRETLIDAKKDPEKYKTLQVRVCGWNVYFVTMHPDEQEYYINSNYHRS